MTPPLDVTGYGPQEPELHPCDTCRGELSPACEGCENYENEEEEE